MKTDFVTIIFSLISIFSAFSSANGFSVPKMPKVFNRIATSSICVTSSIALGCLFIVSIPIFIPNNNYGLTSSRVSALEDVSVFVGKYNDPNHPGCLRQIDQKNSDIVITGSDSLDRSNLWSIKAKQLSPTRISVDFSPKGGPMDLIGNYNEKLNAIQWPDGNSWTKL